MPHQNRVTNNQSNSKSQRHVEVAPVAERAMEFDSIAEITASSAPTSGSDSVENQMAARLHDRRIPVGQRRAMAGQIGEMQGNQHLQRLVASSNEGTTAKAIPAQRNNDHSANGSAMTRITTIPKKNHNGDHSLMAHESTHRGPHRDVGRQIQRLRNGDESYSPDMTDRANTSSVAGATSEQATTSIAISEPASSAHVSDPIQWEDISRGEGPTDHAVPGEIGSPSHSDTETSSETSDTSSNISDSDFAASDNPEIEGGETEAASPESTEAEAIESPQTSEEETDNLEVGAEEEIEAVAEAAEVDTQAGTREDDSGLEETTAGPGSTGESGSLAETGEIGTAGDVEGEGNEVITGPEGFDLINFELAEHERWAGSFGEMGTAGSDQRAQFLLDQAGQGAVSGAIGGAGMGFVMGAVGAGIGQIAGRRLATLAVSRGASATPVPGLGSAIGGVMAVAGLAMRDWGATAETISRFGTGEGYEGLANDLEAVAEALDVATQVMDVLAGILGGIAVGMWVAAVLSAGALSPLAATLSAIALGINLATTAIGIIINVAVRPTVTALRALHTFESQGDPAQIEAEGQQLQAAAGQITGAVFGAAAGKLGGAAGARGGTRADRAITGLQARQTGGTPAMSAAAGSGPRLHVEVPEAPTRVGAEGGLPAHPAVVDPGSVPARPAATDVPMARSSGNSGDISSQASAIASTTPSQTGSTLQAITPPLTLAGIPDNAPIPQGLEPGAIGTYGRAVDDPHPAALASNPPGAEGATAGGGRMPQEGRNAAGVYLEHQTPAAVAHEVIPGHEYHGPEGQRRGGRDTQEALTISLPVEAKPTKDRLDRDLLTDVRARRARGEDVPPIEAIVRGTENTQSAIAQSGVDVPEHQVTRNFLAEIDQFNDPRFGNTEVRPGDPLPPGHPLRDTSDAELGGFLDQTFDPFITPQESGSTPITPSAPVASSPTSRIPSETGTTSTAGAGYTSHTETIRTPDRSAAMAQYHAQISADPGRESGVWRDGSGNYYVMQGDQGSVAPPSAAGPLELIYHSHPTQADVGMQGLVSQPSQAGGDFGVLQHQHGQGPAGRRQSSELHFPTYEEAGAQSGYGATRFAYDPTHPLPLQVETTLPGGRPSQQRYSSFADFEQRTGISAGGMTTAEAVATRMAADAQLRQDVAGAQQRIGDIVEGSQTRPIGLPGMREGSEFGRQMVLEGEQAEASSDLPEHGPAYTTSVPGLQPGESVEIPINPAYPEPPGTIAELEALQAQIGIAQGTQTEITDTENEMAAQADQQRTHSSQLGEAQGVAQELVTGRSTHQVTVDATASTNTEQQTTATDAASSLGQSAEQATALGTLVGSLRVFQGMAHLFSYLPGDLGDAAEGARDDAGELITTLNRVSETEGVQSQIQGGQGEMMVNEQRIEAVSTVGQQTDEELTSGQEQLTGLEEANAMALAETESVKEQATQENIEAVTSENEAQTAHNDLLAQLEAWAQEHRQAREDAIQQATSRFSELGYEVTEEQ